MNPELEALLKAWDAYLQAEKGQEADRLLERYDAQLEEVCCRTKVGKEILDRAVQRAYQRWQWADAPKFPRALRKSKLEGSRPFAVSFDRQAILTAPLVRSSPSRRVRLRLCSEEHAVLGGALTKSLLFHFGRRDS